MKQDVDLERFKKQVLVPGIGVSGLEKLADTTVLFCGLGGGGSVGAHQFVLSNVGRVVLCDHDKVEYSNLGRQYLYDEASIGTYKVLAAEKFLRKTNPNVDVVPIHQKVDLNLLETVYKKYKNLLIYVAIDKWNCHFLINEFCIKNEIPAVHMGSIGFKGFVYVYNPQKTQTCFECSMRQGYIGNIDVTEIDKADTVYPYLPPVISTAGSIAVTEGIKLILNKEKSLVNSFLMYRGTDHADVFENAISGAPIFDQVTTQKNNQCELCKKCI